MNPIYPPIPYNWLPRLCYQRCLHTKCAHQIRVHIKNYPGIVYTKCYTSWYRPTAITIYGIYAYTCLICVCVCLCFVFLHFCAAVQSAHQSNVMEHLRQAVFPVFPIPDPCSTVKYRMRIFWACHSPQSSQTQTLSLCLPHPLPALIVVSAELRARHSSIGARGREGERHTPCCAANLLSRGKGVKRGVAKLARAQNVDALNVATGGVVQLAICFKLLPFVSHSSRA